MVCIHAAVKQPAKQAILGMDLHKLGLPKNLMKVQSNSVVSFAEGARRLECHSVPLIGAVDSTQAVQMGRSVLPINMWGAIYLAKRRLQHGKCFILDSMSGTPHCRLSCIV